MALKTLLSILCIHLFMLETVPTLDCRMGSTFGAKETTSECSSDIPQFTSIKLKPCEGRSPCLVYAGEWIDVELEFKSSDLQRIENFDLTKARIFGYMTDKAGSHKEITHDFQCANDFRCHGKPTGTVTLRTRVLTDPDQVTSFDQSAYMKWQLKDENQKIIICSEHKINTVSHKFGACMRQKSNEAKKKLCMILL